MFELIQFSFHITSIILLVSCLYAANETTKGHCAMRRATLVILLLYVALSTYATHFVRFPLIILVLAGAVNLWVALDIFKRSDNEVCL